MIKRLSYLIVAFVMTLSYLISVDKVYAGGIDFSSNDVLFYNPNESNCIVSGTGSVNLIGNDNIEKVLRYLVGKDLSLIQSSGVVGNLQAESGVDPSRIQSTSIRADSSYTLESGVGFGIAQWTSSGRQDGLTRLSKSSSRDIIDLSLQLDYLWSELSGSYKSTLSKLKSTDNPVDAAVVFHDGFEKSADSEDRVKSVRGGFAQQIYDQFKEEVPDGENSENTSSIGCTGSGEASIFIDGFAIYNQNDSQWNNTPYGTSTIGEAGCGPSAMAMIITALTGNKVTPVDTASYGASHGTFVDGQGSSHNIASVLSKQWDLKSNSLAADEAKVNEVLRSGGLVLAVASGAAPFTTTGHFIVIRAVNENGQWLVGDSNGQAGIANSAKEWNSQDILNAGAKGVNLWVITK